MAFTDIFRASDIKEENEKIQLEYQKIKQENEEIKLEYQKIKQENESFKKLLVEIGAPEIINVKKRLEELKANEQQYLQNRERILEEIKRLNLDLIEKKNQIILVDEQLLLESFALYKPHFSFQNSDEYKNRLDIIRGTQKEMIKSGQAATGGAWTVNGSASEGKKMVNDMIKIAIRSFNNECDYCVDNVKFNNIETNEKRINSSFDALNKLGRIMKVTLSPDYKKLKFDELYLAFEYQQKKQEEKEEQRRLREELREQQKLEEEIKAARDKIIKERTHFSKAISEINAKIITVSNEVELNDLNTKLTELQEKYGELDDEEKIIDYREKNGKAGYVYIISNIGSFGQDIFKIGMTRRLEPIERINELGDASVPFPFDIHALIFSDNAPELEAKIQQHFQQGKLNKINNRKEFFRAEIHELEKTVKEHYNKVVDFIATPPAEQYRESLLV